MIRNINAMFTNSLYSLKHKLPQIAAVLLITIVVYHNKLLFKHFIRILELGFRILTEEFV